MTSCSCFSQNLNLKPTVQQIKGDTLFCFTIAQSKEIAEHIERGFYQDSIASRLELENTRLYLIFNKQDSVISMLELKANNLESITRNQTVNIELLNSTIQIQKKKLKRSKLHKTLLSIGLGAAIAITINN